MKTDHILKADLLDILFDNRNKKYGAYQLRKFYNKRLYKALGLTFICITLVSLFVVLHKSEHNLIRPGDIDTVLGQILPVALLEKPKPVVKAVRPAHAAIQPPLKSEVFISTIEIVDDPADASKLPVDLDNVVISNVTSDPVTGGKQLIHADPGPVVKAGGAPDPVSIVDKNKPLAIAEVMPSYPGGEAALIKFLQRNLENPESLEEGEMVSVKIKFIVGYDGVLKGFETVQDGGTAFNNEVIRVLKKMPNWIPGKTSGENVSVYYTIPVKFVLQD